MNPLANSYERSILLPPGCKDLMDVLSAQRRQEATFGPEVLIGELGQLERHVEKLFASTAPSRILIIAPLHGIGHVVLEPSNNGMSIYPDTGAAETGESVNEFFAARNIRPSVDYSFRAWGMRIRILGFPLPYDPRIVSQLTTDLFTSVYEVDAETEMEFTFTCSDVEADLRNSSPGS